MIEMYDYRHELLEILRHTTSDSASLSQTQRSLTTILRLLNELQPFDDREHVQLPQNEHYRDSRSYSNSHSKGGHDHHNRHFRMRQRYRGPHPIDSDAPSMMTHELDKAASEAMPSSVSGDFASLLNRSLSNAADQQPTEALDDIDIDARLHAQAEKEHPHRPEPLTEAELAAKHHYVVHRKLSGALINHQYYPESVLHELPFELSDGDVVAAAPAHGNELPEIKEITDDHLPRQVQAINVIRHAILKSVNGTKMLQIEGTRDGHSVLDNEPGANILIDPKHYANRNLKPGMEIDYAYYDHGNALRDAKSGTIRWVYEETADNQADSSAATAHRSAKATAKPQTAKHHSKPSPIVVSDDFDLKQRKVLVISAKPKQKDELKSAVNEHHGIYYRLDASQSQNVTSSKLKQAIRQADLVIVCQDGIDKKTSELAERHSQKYDKKFALSSASDKRALSHALARAIA
ncbi:DUF2325 domain-containing protein [Limosilactobacillus sp.]|uniref:DUF2325 domain-containing protein n=1 Tax=Limosilactobacillus sp. TaxID=2773925 RepID=UPI00345E9FDA